MDALTYIQQKYNLTDYTTYGTKPIVLQISRWDDLPNLFNELGYKIGAEIGVADGSYSERLCQRIPGLQLFCIDAWEHYHDYREVVTQSKLDDLYIETQQRLAPYNCKIVRSYSIDAAKEIPSKSLDFVYIDANHSFAYVAQDIHLWSPKVRKGGIIAGHDYGRHTNPNYHCHVKDVVQAWAYAYGIYPWFVVRNDAHASWFWVKQ